MEEKKKYNGSKNLIPGNKRSPEEMRALASKAGKASAEKRKYNKTFKAAVEWALSLDAFRGNPAVDMIHKRYPDLNNRDAIAIAATAKAIQTGDIKAFVAIRDTTGELPEQTVNVKNDKITINISMLDELEDDTDVDADDDTEEEA